MADDDLKSLIGALVQRLDTILPTLATKDDIARLEAGQARLEARVDRLEEGQARLEDGQARMEARASRLEEGQARMEGEQRQIKEMLGVVRMKDVARLDGRIDQLAMDVALGRKPAAE